MKVPTEPSYDSYVTLSCPDDYDPLAYKGMCLLKKIKGMPGDPYVISEDHLTLRAHEYPIYHMDYLPQLTPGSYTVPDHQYLFLNDTRFSFDSRYIGPVSKANIQAHVILLIDYEEIAKWYQKYIGGNPDANIH